MTQTFAKTLLATSIVLACGLNAAHAKDWIEKVEIKQGGIDLVPVNIRSNGIKYTTTAKPTHDFKLGFYAKAKSGKRFFFAVAQSGVIAPRFGIGGKNGEIIKSDGRSSRFGVVLENRDIGSGHKRTWSRDVTYRIDLRQIKWDGFNPGEACNDLLAKKLLQGQPRAAILSKVQQTESEAVFHLRAAAAKPATAQSNVPIQDMALSKWTDEASGMRYKVKVRCLPSPNQENQVQPQQPEEQDQPAPNKISQNPEGNLGRTLLTTLPVIIGIGLLVSGGGSPSSTGR